MELKNNQLKKELILEKKPKIINLKNESEKSFETKNNPNIERIRNSRAFLLYKNEINNENVSNTSFPIIKKLTQEQKDILEGLEKEISKEEESNLKISPVSVIEQAKIILTIIRNLGISSFNERIIYNEKKLLNMLYDLLLYNNDSEIDKLCLENFAILSRYFI